MKALVWEGVNELAVTSVPDPRILNRQDAVLKVSLSSVCGSDSIRSAATSPSCAPGM